jgi:hypothetical protein
MGRFDGAMMNRVICFKSFFFSQSFSSYFQEVLASYKLSLDDNEIQLHKDGAWSTHISQKETCSLDTPMKPAPVQQVEVISDDLGNEF